MHIGCGTDNPSVCFDFDENLILVSMVCSVLLPLALPVHWLFESREKWLFVDIIAHVHAFELMFVHFAYSFCSFNVIIELATDFFFSNFEEFLTRMRIMGHHIFSIDKIFVSRTVLIPIRLFTTSKLFYLIQRAMHRTPTAEFISFSLKNPYNRREIPSCRNWIIWQMRWNGSC